MRRGSLRSAWLFGTSGRGEAQSHVRRPIVGREGDSGTARGAPRPATSSLPRATGRAIARVPLPDRELAGARRTARRPRRRGGWFPSLVESHLADWRRLLLHARLPARHRPAGGGRRGADCDRHSRVGHAAWRAAGLRTGGRAQLCRAGIDRPAREPPGGLEGKSAGAAAARLRRHGLRHHDDVVRGRRRQARHREPVSPAWFLASTRFS